MGSWFAKLPKINFFGNSKIQSSCCNEASYSYHICGRCGSRVKLSDLKYAEYDIREEHAISDHKNS